MRRMAVAMLGHECTAPDRRLVPSLKRILDEEEARKLRFHAERALKRCAEAELRV